MEGEGPSIMEANIEEVADILVLPINSVLNSALIRAPSKV